MREARLSSCCWGEKGDLFCGEKRTAAALIIRGPDDQGPPAETIEIGRVASGYRARNEERRERLRMRETGEGEKEEKKTKRRRRRRRGEEKETRLEGDDVFGTGNSTDAAEEGRGLYLR